MMQEVLQLRGLMKRKLPNIRSGKMKFREAIAMIVDQSKYVQINLFLIRVKGSMGPDLAKMIGLFSKGLEFSSSKDQYELDYGLVEVPFGRVNIWETIVQFNGCLLLVYCSIA